MNNKNVEYPAILIEIPHQRPAKVYTAENEDRLIEICCANAGDDWEWPENPSLSDYEDGFSHDLHRGRILYGRMEAEEFVGAGMPGTKHQAMRVESLLRKAMTDLGWLNGNQDDNDDDDDDEQPVEKPTTGVVAKTAREILVQDYKGTFPTDLNAARALVEVLTAIIQRPANAQTMRVAIGNLTKHPQSGLSHEQCLNVFNMAMDGEFD